MRMPTEDEMEQMNNMTAQKAKKIMVANMEAMGLPAYQMSAKRWDFSGFGCGTCITVTVKGFPRITQGSPLVEQWQSLKRQAVESGFRISLD